MSLAFFRVPLAALVLAAAPCSLVPFGSAPISAAQFSAAPFSSAWAAEPSPPVTVITHFDIIPNGDNVAQATALLQKFVADSRSDPGVISFTLITWAPTTNHFQLLEVFGSQEAFDRHVAAAHSIAFRTAIQPFVGAPLDERLYTQNRRDDDHR
jgi:quinol monooxygenase YgiN